MCILTIGDYKNCLLSDLKDIEEISLGSNKWKELEYCNIGLHPEELGEDAWNWKMQEETFELIQEDYMLKLETYLVDVITHLPVFGEEACVPYVYVPSKEAEDIERNNHEFWILRKPALQATNLLRLGHA